VYPVLFSFGNFQVHTYGFMGAIGFLIVAFLSIYRGKQEGIAGEHITDLLFWASLTALAGSRALYVIQNPEHFDTWTQWFNLRTGGLVFYGAMLAGLPAGAFMMYWHKIPFYKMWDILGAAFPVGHIAARIGCFGAGCCYGRHSDGVLSVIFTHPQAVAPLNTPLHPVQLYEACWLMITGGVVNAFYTKKTFDGQVMLLYLCLYTAGRSFIETFRGDVARGLFMESVFGDKLSYSQGVSILLAILALAVFLVGARRAAARQG
jgi:phosphatidylglycerol:prolipoprotein diacylglycerol transferase